MREEAEHMAQVFYVRSAEQAHAIIDAYRKCGICSDCPLNSPEGWRCSYLEEQARRYLERHGESVNQ